MVQKILQFSFPNKNLLYITRSEASSGGSKIIGDITIAEYEGSPRRYRPRTSPPAQIRESNVTTSTATSASAAASAAAAVSKQQSNKQQRPPLRLPGFPQRVLPPTENNNEEVNLTSAAASAAPVTAASDLPSSTELELAPSEELLKFEDAPTDLRPQMITEATDTTSCTNANSNDYESKMRYEFSETRKVLDEFFHKDPTDNERFAIISQHSAGASLGIEERGGKFYLD